MRFGYGFFLLDDDDPNWNVEGEKHTVKLISDLEG